MKGSTSGEPRVQKTVAFSEKVFDKHLKEFYNKYVIRKRLMHGYSPKFRTEFYALHALIKERLRLESEGFEHRDWSGVYSKL